MPQLFDQRWPTGDFAFFQLGFVVDDIVRAANRWVSTFGVGPFHVIGPVRSDLTRDGATAPIELQVAVAQAGPVQIELIQQHCDTPSIFNDFVKVGGGVLHQLCTLTDDFERKVASFEHAGYRVATTLSAPGHRVAFIDTYGDFGFYTEVVSSTPGFVENITAIANTCATWDGVTDPIRLLTRDGYRVP